VNRIIALLSLCATVAAQGGSNDVPLNNGGDVIVGPSGGTSVGSNPATGTWGELYWRALPGDRVLAYEHPGGAQTLEIDGFVESLFDTDWSTSPALYDRIVGPAAPSGLAGLAPCALEPAFFQAGLTSEVQLSFGPSGFPPPCSIVPSLCSPSGGSCPAPGFLNGYEIEMVLGASPGSGVVVPADGTSASDLAVTYLITGGMTSTGGTCGAGDYVLQQVVSIDETQADDCLGYSSFGGFHVPGTGPIPDAVTSSLEQNVTFREPVLNVVADSGSGVEQNPIGGGALNGLKLDTSNGLATIGAELRDEGAAGRRGFVFWSRVPLAAGSATFLGAPMLVPPTLGGPACFHGPISGALTTCQIAVAPVPQPVDVYWQGVSIDPVSGVATATNRVRTTLF